MMTRAAEEGGSTVCVPEWKERGGAAADAAGVVKLSTAAVRISGSSEWSHNGVLTDSAVLPSQSLLYSLSRPLPAVSQ